jgi:tetratricopeptide (TPR) repeat protein
MSKNRISRKKLLQEPDEFLSLSQRALLWAHENRERAAIAVGVVVAVVLVGVGAKALVERSRDKRAEAVSAVVARYAQAADGAIPADLQRELAAVAERYAGAPEADVARYFQAGALASAGEVEKARQIYTALAAPAAVAGDLAVASQVALAYLELAGGGADAALASFERILKTAGSAVPRAQLLWEIAGIHEKQNRAAEARKIYQELLAAHPDGSWAAEAKERLRALDNRVPSAS